MITYREKNLTFFDSCKNIPNDMLNMNGPSFKYHSWYLLPKLKANAYFKQDTIEAYKFCKWKLSYVTNITHSYES